VLETWKFLGARFFHHLDASYSAVVPFSRLALPTLEVLSDASGCYRRCRSWRRRYCACMW
jgi:hypothetical protein